MMGTQKQSTSWSDITSPSTIPDTDLHFANFRSPGNELPVGNIIIIIIIIIIVTRNTARQTYNVVVTDSQTGRQTDGWM